MVRFSFILVDFTLEYTIPFGDVNVDNVSPPYDCKE
jgi:hypothetical protein